MSDMLKRMVKYSNNNQVCLLKRVLSSLYAADEPEIYLESENTSH